MEHVIYELRHLDCSETSSVVGAVLAEYDKYLDALNALLSCERLGILTCLVPYIWYSEEKDET